MIKSLNKTIEPDGLLVGVELNWLFAEIDKTSK